MLATGKSQKKNNLNQVPRETGKLQDLIQKGFDSGNLLAFIFC